MDSFKPGLSFSPVAEISARLKTRSKMQQAIRKTSARAKFNPKFYPRLSSSCNNRFSPD